MGEQNRTDNVGGRVTLMTFAMLDCSDYEAICGLLLENKLFHLFLDLEILCSRQHLILHRENLIRAMFCQAVKQGKESVTIYMSVQFESLLSRSAGQVAQILLSMIEKSPAATKINEANLSILQRL